MCLFELYQALYRELLVYVASTVPQEHITPRNAIYIITQIAVGSKNYFSIEGQRVDNLLGVGRRYHKDFFYALLFQQHKAGEQGGDVPCFACACAGFDKVGAVNGDGERVERGGGGHVGSLKTGWGGETTGAMIA